ncbi:DUF2177 family protein [Erythrobacter sp. F6033]|uniref:DUF2177 family protein n=1 Tax=Erythrobacter sp. F6033 TaxID=2926401 RepID=UPI001FF0ECFB|nr:DUF2177 family protein [Erythrobacter sp. F6033]MCK0128488.1 DUF2177 family protein [Erythrobacter sp. F6033]
MSKYVIAYVCSALVFGSLDAMWLNWAGPNLYRPLIGEIMAESFNVGAAAVFYFAYLAGMLWFAIRPGLQSGKVSVALLNGVLLGALCYATFDLTSQAVFKVWATKVTVLDIIWGGFATGVTSAVATFVTLRFTK